jgi:hypothetical protein
MIFLLQWTATLRNPGCGLRSTPVHGIQRTSIRKSESRQNMRAHIVRREPLGVLCKLQRRPWLSRSEILDRRTFLDTIFHFARHFVPRLVPRLISFKPRLSPICSRTMSNPAVHLYGDWELQSVLQHVSSLTFYKRPMMGRDTASSAHQLCNAQWLGSAFNLGCRSRAS